MSNASKLKDIESPKVWQEEDFSPRIQLVRKKLREFAKANREENERFQVRFNSLHSRGSIFRYNAATDGVFPVFTGREQPVESQQVRVEYKPHTSYGLSVIVANFRSLLPKIDALKACIYTCSADLVIGTETWLSDNVESSEVALLSHFLIFW